MSTPEPVFSGVVAVVIRRAVTTVAFVIAGLTFTFGFFNVYELGVRLGVSGVIAPLVAPAVDLSVLALLAALQYLRAHGVVSGLAWPRMLLVFCGIVTLALNTAEPVLVGAYGRAAFDAIAPTLLLGWAETAPRLLGLLHSAVPDRPVVPSPSVLVRDDQAALPTPELVATARQLDEAHQAETGKPITRDVLRANLRVSNALTGAVLSAIREPAEADDEAAESADLSTD
ncbi:SpdA protein [Fodinicola acaciae]|uniref:SpdA protein n=1 Tax=Fodinicola acaciae TaxID=2681555 RepID=UPI0013D5A838|nr:SpdA protein [Fodinicola acaciae]